MNDELKVLTDTLRHRSEVQENLAQMASDLQRRGIVHDLSKLEPFEFDAFVKTRPKFEKANYGSLEYKECCDLILPALAHHYANNRHHTRHFDHGFADMNVLDILEMLADWKAASRRSPDLSFENSLPKAFEIYQIPKTMQRHILSTLKYLGWIEATERAEL